MNHKEEPNSELSSTLAPSPDERRKPKRPFWRRRRDREIDVAAPRFPGLTLIGPNRMPQDWRLAA